MDAACVTWVWPPAPAIGRDDPPGPVSQERSEAAEERQARSLDMAKARRGRKRTAPRADRQPAFSGREHWRADGRPKTRFDDQDAANRSSLRLRLEEGADLDPYQCSVCGAWHLGNRSE
jgi:hypothetical protein